MIPDGQPDPNANSTFYTDSKTLNSQSLLKTPMDRGRPYRRLYRSKSNKIIAGVAGGLGEYFNIDPVLIRLLFIAVGLFNLLAALLFYLIAWLIMPVQPEVQNLPSQQSQVRLSRIVAVVLGILMLWIGSSLIVGFSLITLAPFFFKDLLLIGSVIKLALGTVIVAIGLALLISFLKQRTEGS